MKIILLILFLFKVDAFSQDSICSKLFSISGGELTPQEKTDDALVVYNYTIAPMQIILNDLREKYIKTNPYTPEGMKLAKEIISLENEIRQINSKITKTLSDLLKYRNINHKIVSRFAGPYAFDYFIVFSPEGSHYINVLAKKLFDKYKLELSIDLPALLQNGSSALYGILNKSNSKILFNPSILAKYSFFQDGAALHEFTHHLDFNQLRENIPRPYHANIEITLIPPELKNKLGIYSHGFSVDEIKAYRSTIRALIHEAITEKKFPTRINESFVRIKRAIELEISFSQTVNNIFKKYKAMEDRKITFADRLWRRTTVPSDKIERVKIYVSPIEKYYVTSKPNMIVSAIEMSDFTLKLYTTIYSKIVEIENKDPEEKLKLLKQIAKVLSIPEIRRLNGKYPSLEKINSMLSE